MTMRGGCSGSGLLNASTALLVARIPTAKLRARAIKEITEKDYHGDTIMRTRRTAADS